MNVVPPPPRLLARGRGFRTPRLDSAAALLAVTLVVLAVVLLFMNFPSTTGGTANATPTPRPGSTAVLGTTPNVIGQDLEDGVAALRRAGFTALVSWDIDQSGRGRPCVITSQDPAAGAPIPANRRASVRYVRGEDCAEDID